MKKGLLFFTLWTIVNASYLSQKLDVNYDKRLSPYYLSGQSVNVSLSIPFLLLVNMVEDQQILSWLATFTIVWRDDRLRYNPSQFGDETKIFVPSTEVWTPRFIIYNSIEQRKLIDDGRNDVMISPDGQVKLQVTQYINTICPLKVARMPFDTQFCAIRITSPLQSRQYAFLQGHLAEHVAMIEGDSEFILKNLSVRDHDYDFDEEIMHEVYFVAELRRCPNYFIIVIVVPSFLISTMTITGILLPVHGGTGGDAIAVGLASMLALSITLSVVAETLPRTSSVPLIGSYILACLGICSFAVIIGLLLTHLKNADHRVTRWVTRSLAFKKASNHSEKLPEVSRQSSINDEAVRKHERQQTITRLYTCAFGFLQVSLLTTLLIFFSFWWRNPPSPPSILNEQ